MTAAFDQELRVISERTKDKRATLAIDGWSNVVNCPVLGVAINVDSSDCIFIEAINTMGILLDIN